MTTICSLAVIAASLLVVQFISFSTAQDRACKLSPDAGPCDQFVQRYYYDKKTGTCQTFRYGGCDGNANKFLTNEDCESTCKSGGACDLPPEEGPCEARLQRYYYNKETGSCKPFIYGGCKGNANRFYTQKACERKCKKGGVCELPSKHGPCILRFKRYYYDKEMGTCNSFIYGGCGANANNFLTKEDCENTCQIGGACDLPPKSGTCSERMVRYYFDENTDTCKTFAYSGCNGNANNFLTKEACENVCQKVSVCDQPLKVGTCRAKIPSYYYDRQEDTCRRFIYSGCGGNENRFPSRENCENMCKSATYNCDLAPDRGPCKQYKELYYFDNDTNTCKTFIYGGCRGNGNRFPSKHECQRFCIPVNGTSSIWHHPQMYSWDDQHMFS